MDGMNEVQRAAAICDDDDGAVDGPTVDAHVDMAKNTCKLVFVRSAASYVSPETDTKVTVAELAIQINVPNFQTMLRRFLYDQLYPDCPLTSSNVPLFACPSFDGKISI